MSPSWIENRVPLGSSGRAASIRFCPLIAVVTKPMARSGALLVGGQRRARAVEGFDDEERRGARGLSLYGFGDDDRALGLRRDSRVSPHRFGGNVEPDERRRGDAIFRYDVGYWEVARPLPGGDECAIGRSLENGSVDELLERGTLGVADLDLQCERRDDRRIGRVSGVAPPSIDADAEAVVVDDRARAHENCEELIGGRAEVGRHQLGGLALAGVGVLVLANGGEYHRDRADEQERDEHDGQRHRQAISSASSLTNSH